MHDREGIHSWSQRAAEAFTGGATIASLAQAEWVSQVLVPLYGGAIKEKAQQYKYFSRESHGVGHQLKQFLESIKLTRRNIHSVHKIVWVGMDRLSTNLELIDPNKTKDYPLTCILVKFMNSGKMEKIWVKRAVLQALWGNAVADDIIYAAAKEQENRRRE